jgi:hypothetical protein
MSESRICGALSRKENKIKSPMKIKDSQKTITITG